MVTGHVRIALLGDLAANDAILARLERGQQRQIAGNVAPVTRQCQLVVANLEASWDREGLDQPAGGPEKTHVRTNPSVVKLLKQLNVSVVSAANNHSFDFGFHGWAALRAKLQAAGVRCVGGGADLNDAAQPLVFQRNGNRIGLLAYADPDCGAILADVDTPGANPFDLARAVAEIRDLKKSCTCVVVCFHWGEERVQMPSPKLRGWARQLARAGADIVAGHHPHVLQGYEQVHGSHVFYSLGNFLMADVFDNGRCTARYRGHNYWSAIPILECRPHKPVRLNHVIGIHSTGDGVVAIAHPRSFARKWRKLCRLLQLPDYEKRFFRHQAFMWRYYIPIRYRLLPDPLGTLRRLRLSKIARLLGCGQSPWRQKSVE